MIQIRRAESQDWPDIRDIMASHDMDASLDAADFLIALADEKVIGAVRKEIVGNSEFIRPIVIAEGWKKQGIGKALIERIRMNLDEIWVVARGTAVGFYAHLGFLPSCWKDLPDVLRQECEECCEREICQPKLMVWNHTIQEVD